MADRVSVVITELTRVTEALIRKLGLDVTANLIETTPVDTGWARANWVPSIGVPVLTTAGSSEAVSSGEQQAGQASLLGYSIEQGSVFVSNNVPYILRLNDGSSVQAPAGFVELAIAKAVTQDILGFRG